MKAFLNITLILHLICLAACTTQEHKRQTPHKKPIEPPHKTKTSTHSRLPYPRHSGINYNTCPRITETQRHQHYMRYMWEEHGPNSYD